jgi:hypothetical protein
MPPTCVHKCDAWKSESDEDAPVAFPDTSAVYVDRYFGIRKMRMADFVSVVDSISEVNIQFDHIDKLLCTKSNLLLYSADKRCTAFEILIDDFWECFTETLMQLYVYMKFEDSRYREPQRRQEFFLLRHISERVGKAVKKLET